MADIAINKSFMTKGRMSISRALDTESSPPILCIKGQLVMHRYIEEITTIETHRYKLCDVNVYREDFGSEDFNIIYYFTAKDLLIKGGESDLTEDEITEIENMIYNNQEVNGGE